MSSNKAGQKNLNQTIKEQSFWKTDFKKLPFWKNVLLTWLAVFTVWAIEQTYHKVTGPVPIHRQVAETDYDLCELMAAQPAFWRKIGLEAPSFERCMGVELICSEVVPGVCDTDQAAIMMFDTNLRLMGYSKENPPKP
jgi:hypothetical protein